MLTQAIIPKLPDWLRKQYPFRTRKLTIGDLAMSFVDEGAESAPPLLLLHGSPTWSYLFRKSIPKLAERFRVVAPDLIGFGLSDKPTDPGYHTLETHVRNFGAVIEALGLRGISLALHGWGGPIGLSWALRAPENVTRILLMNTWAAPPRPSKPLKLPFPMRFMPAGMRSDYVVRRNLELRQAIRTGALRAISTDVMSAYEYPFTDPRSRTAIGAFAEMMTGGGTWNLAAELRSIRARVEILWGERDPVLRGKLPAYVLRDAFPNAADPVFLRNASHLVPEDAPEQITDKLLEPFRPKPAAPAQLFNILK